MKTYLITIKEVDSDEERRGLVHANSMYVALVKFANQVDMGIIAKLVPGVKMSKIVQIAATAHRIYALDDAGQVWIYDGKERNKEIKMEWRKLEDFLGNSN